jgi:hypothetical protein
MTSENARSGGRGVNSPEDAPASVVFYSYYFPSQFEMSTPVDRSSGALSKSRGDREESPRGLSPSGSSLSNSAKQLTLQKMKAPATASFIDLIKEGSVEKATARLQVN